MHESNMVYSQTRCCVLLCRYPLSNYNQTYGKLRVCFTVAMDTKGPSEFGK